MKQSRVVSVVPRSPWRNVFTSFCLEMQLSSIKSQQFTGSLTHILMWE